MKNTLYRRVILTESPPTMQLQYFYNSKVHRFVRDSTPAPVLKKKHDFYILKLGFVKESGLIIAIGWGLKYVDLCQIYLHTGKKGNMPRVIYKKPYEE